MTRLRNLLAASLALMGALLLPLSPAAAWWEYGHQTVARIAYLEVNPQTRAGIDRLLRQSKLLDTPTCPARTIEEASVWPDCVKTLGDRFSYAYNWHFVDIDVCKPFDPKGPCAGGNCVITQIERNQRLLADTAPQPARTADGAGLPRPFRRRSAPAAPRCRTRRRSGRQQAARPLWRDRGADEHPFGVGRAARRTRHLHRARRRQGVARRHDARKPRGDGCGLGRGLGEGELGSSRATPSIRPRRTAPPARRPSRPTPGSTRRRSSN